MEKDEMNEPFTILLIGGSAGSIDVLMKTFPHIQPSAQLAIVLVIHRKNSGDSILIDLLSARTDFIVKEAEEKETITGGTIYIAPPDYHLLFEKDFTFSLDVSEKVNFSRPSIDVTFASAANVFENNTAALLLSGANADGVNGLYIIKEKKGIAAVQDYKTAEVPYMPQQAMERLQSLLVLSVEQIPGFINSLAAGIK